MITEIRAVVLCSLLAWMIAGCDQDVLYATSFTEVATERAKLIDGIESYQSTEEAKHQFQKWEVIEESGLAPGDKRPPFNIYVVAINNYSHLDYSGKLHLKFFNNRLVEARFYPSSFEKYVERLKENDKLTFNITDKSAGTPEALAAPYTRIWIYNQPHLDPQGQNRYVGWRDARLEKEETLWIKRYS
ncbi:MAG: hypothetical protein Q8L77_14195 [Nitrospirota bacterium]|nr:hypothetical protein [Nitrospirota bacterium]